MDKTKADLSQQVQEYDSYRVVRFKVRQMTQEEKKVFYGSSCSTWSLSTKNCHLWLFYLGANTNKFIVWPLVEPENSISAWKKKP